MKLASLYYMCIFIYLYGDSGATYVGFCMEKMLNNLCHEFVSMFSTLSSDIHEQSCTLLLLVIGTLKQKSP